MSRNARLFVNVLCAAGGWFAAQGVIHVAVCGVGLSVEEGK